MKEAEWTTIIRPHSSLFNLKLKELYHYRDLLILFVKRDIVINYKQTILGPLWFFIQPILTMLIFTFVFGNIAGISTDGIPQPLFYLSGIIIWNYFSECFTKTSNTFTENASIFGKVYFPRLISPLSIVISNGLKFIIQFLLFVGLLIYYSTQGFAIRWSTELLLFPFLVILMGVFGLGFGLIFSSLTTKYRDLKFLLVFGVQLMMYMTPIIYPMSSLPEKVVNFMWYNPFAHIVESFKAIFLGQGLLSMNGLIYSSILGVSVLLMGILIFNKTERRFMDTV